MSKTLFKRKTLDQVVSVPDDIIDVYVVEDHIWADKGSQEARKKRQPELNTVRDFLIDPVRSLLEQVFRQIAAPYDPSKKTEPIGQGWWVQAEFGSGKSHLLSAIGALSLGDKDAWEIVREKEQKAGKGKRESLYNFYENGIAKKSSGKSKGVFVVVKTLVGQGGGTIGVTDTGRGMTEYILDAVHDQYEKENGKTISLYPVEMLADRFEQKDFDRCQKALKEFLKDPRFDDDQQPEFDVFLDTLRNGTASQRRDCGNLLWRFYTEYLETTPKIPAETEDVLEHMVRTLLADGYEGVLLILDEVSLFMKNRKQDQQDDDEKTLVVLSNRIAKHSALPLWTICSAQQAIEERTGGVKNIIANDRLKLVPLLQDEQNYFDIVLTRVRTITDEHAPEVYFEEYRPGFSWVDSVGKTKFTQYFPFFPDAIDVLRALSYHLTTARSSIHFMHGTLKRQCKVKSNELLSLWQMFDDVVEYSEDPSGTTQGIAAIKTKFQNEWRAYESARKSIGQATKGHLKVYRPRCEKILKILFLYDVAKLAPNGLPVETLMNSVMEWKDHDKGQEADITDNLDHYEALCGKLDTELPQVRKVGKNFKFEPVAAGVDIRDLYQKARAQAEASEVLQRQAWDQLLALDSWDIQTPLMKLDLAYETKSIFRQIAPADQKYEIEWHGRTLKGIVCMRDLGDVAKNLSPLPPINSPDTDQDFAVFVSNRPCGDKVADIAARIKEHRALYWTPGDLSQAERDRLIDFAAYRQLVADFKPKDDQDAKDVLNWVADRLKGEMGTIYKIVPDSYSRGRICAVDHANMTFTCEGELRAILEPLVGQVLNAVYESASIKFDAPASFSDNEAIKLINGIVCKGEIPKGTKPNQYTSAAENYGYALGVIQKSKPKQLDPTGCVFVDDIEGWLGGLFDQSTTPTVESVYKNFTGTSGPNGKHYGLSRRMIDIFLLTLVRQGKIRITLTGKPATITPHLDVSNLADTPVNAALLNGMSQIHKLKAPEGWPVLAPYAAVLLDDKELTKLNRDDQIQDALVKLQKYQEEKKPHVETLIERLGDLCADIEQPNPVEDTLKCWKDFFESHIDPDDAIPFWLHALEKSFDYKTHTDEEAKQSEVDDMTTRKLAWERAAAFCNHDRDIRAAHRYSKLELASGSVLSVLQKPLKTLAKRLAKLEDLMESTPKLQSQLLEPLGEVRETYKTRYLQAYDEVTGKCEAVRQAVDSLSSSPKFTALTLLEQIDALRSINTDALHGRLASCTDGLFSTTLDRNAIERALIARPIPEECSLHVDEANQHVSDAEKVEQDANGLVNASLVSAAKLLQQPALTNLLEQGKGDPFIDDVLAASDTDSLAVLLAQQLSEDGSRAKLLAKWLKKIQVMALRLSDFQPSKATVEKGDVDQIVAEFRSFLETAFTQDGNQQSVIVEFRQ